MWIVCSTSEWIVEELEEWKHTVEVMCLRPTCLNPQNIQLLKRNSVTIVILCLYIFQLSKGSTKSKDENFDRSSW